MKLLLLLFTAFAVHAADNDSSESPVFVKEETPKPVLNYTAYTKYFNMPEGTATVVQDGKVVRKGKLIGVGFGAGDTILLSKGLHFIDTSRRTTSVSEDMRIGDMPFDLRRGVMTFQGEGADTIIIEAGFAKEKRAPKQLRFATESLDDVYLKNLTFVNSEWDVLRHPDVQFKVFFQNVRFEGGFSQTQKRPIKNCTFCVFDHKYDDMTETGIAHIGSIYFDGSKYVELESGPSKAPEFQKFMTKLAASRKNGGLANGVDAATVRALYVAIGEGKVGSLGDQDEQVRQILASNYKFEIPKDSKIEGIMARSRAQLKSGHPLIASLIASMLPKDMDKRSAEDAKKLWLDINLDLTKTYSLCAPSASIRKTESSVERFIRDGKLPDLVNKKIGSAIETKYPILMMADPAVCKMNFQFIKNTLMAGVDDKDQTVARDIVEDLDAMAKAQEARNSAMFAASASIGAMAKGMSDANEKMWRQQIDKSTHFEQHVGGTDLVSWKMDRSVKFEASNFASSGPPIASGFTKQVDRIVVNYRFLTKPDLQAQVIISDRGKQSITPLAHLKTPYVEASCQAKYEIDPSTGGPGPEVPPDFGKQNDCPQRIKGRFSTDYSVYTSMAIMPVVDSYVVQYVLPAFEKAAKKASTSKSGDDRSEAALMSLFFKQKLNDDQLNAVKKATGLSDPEGVMLATASKNFERNVATQSLTSAEDLREAPFDPGGACVLPSTIGFRVYLPDPCQDLFKPASGKTIAIQSEGIGHFACERRYEDADLPSATAYYDTKLENAVIGLVSQVSSFSNKPKSVQDWNESFEGKLLAPFGANPALPQYAYASYRNEKTELTSLVQLELKKSGEKMVLADVYCALCDSKDILNPNSSDPKWKHLFDACVRLKLRAQ